MTKDMTEGNIWKHLFSFAIPLLLGNLFQQTYNMIDTAIVGQYLGEEKLASVGASSSVQFLVLGFCMGICCGFAIPVSQHFGAKNTLKMKEAIFHAGFLSILFAAVITTACAILCPNILHILSTPENIFDDAYSYLFIIFLGIPFTILYNLLSGLLRAVGDSKTPFLFLVFSSILNIILDLTFIIVFKLGVSGAALATIMSQGVSGLLCLIYIIKKFPILCISKEHCRIKSDMTKQMIAMGVPMGLQYSITAIGSMVMQSANNGLGSTYISGFTAGMRMPENRFTVCCPFDAIATAASTFCSQNFGAGNLKRIKEGLKKGVTIGVSYGLISGLILIFFGRTLSLLFIKASASAVLDASGKYLACLGYFFWALGILNVCRMSVQGLGYAGRAVFSGAVEMIARIFVSVLLVPVFKFNAICFADQTAWICACLYIVPTCLLCLKKI